MKYKVKVLIIENSIDVTGALKSIIRASFNLKDFFDFQFVIPIGSRGRVLIEEMGFTFIHELPMKEISRNFASLVFYLPSLIINMIRLRRIVIKQKIDLIHLNDLYNILPVVYRCFGGTTPYVCHIRFLPDKFPKFLFDIWLKLHLRYAGKIIAVSYAVMRQLPINAKILVIHDELPLEERYPRLREPMEFKTIFTFLYLSNFIIGKGQNYALETFAKIHQALPNWKLRFVGGDMGLVKNQVYRKSLQERAVELGIFEKTEWIGFTKDVELVYKQADIVLNFSESESFSITCIEALFFGRPMIVTDCGGPAEIIDHNTTGILVPNRNCVAMANAMLRLAKDKDWRDALGKAGSVSIRKKFESGDSLLEFRNLYYHIHKQKTI